jgi:uncharacterized protein (DUF2147 family)
MRHHVFTAAIGFMAAAVLVPATTTQAAAADPTGIWRKADQGERPGKIEVFRCGSGKRYICAKIVWLQDPNDSKGNPLRDVRNENPSMRGRAIMGLPIINGMAPVAANQWKGSIYNPEDGNTYSATLTLVAQNQIKLKGCKAWLLCGERTWLRTSLPKPEPEPEAQIEAAAEPETETAAAEPEAENNAFANAEMLTPVVAQGTTAGYRFLNGSTSTTDAGFSGENVPSMFAMNKPFAGTEAADEAGASQQVAATAPAAAQSAQPTPVSQPKPAAPKPQTIQANAAPAPQPQAAPSPGSAQAAEVEGLEPIDATETETAEAEIGDQRKLSFRERRQLRRQQRTMEQQSEGLLPWLR